MGLLVLALAPVALVWTPKAGDRAVYDATGTLVFQGMEAPTRGTFTETVKTVADGKVTVTETIKLTALFAEREGEVPLVPTESTLRPDGTVTALTADANSALSYLRMRRLYGLVLPKAPVEVGASWSSDLPPDPKTEGLGIKTTYTLLGEEKAGGKDAYKIAAKGGETGAGKGTVVATFWIDEKTGLPLHEHFELKGMDDGPSGEALPSRFEQDLVIRP